MKLKIFDIDRKVVIRNSNDYKDLDNVRGVEEKSFKNNRFYVFSLQIKSKANPYGVNYEKSDTTESLNNALSKIDATLLRIRFIIVDTICKSVYYDGNKEDVKKVMSELFDIHHQELNDVIELSELKRLTELTIKTKVTGQLDFDDNFDSAYSNEMFDGLYEDGTVEETLYKLVLTGKGGLLNSDKMRKLISECSTNRRSITAKGFDKDGAAVSISKHSSKKIEILLNDSSWDARRELELEIVLEELINVIKER